MEELIEEFRNWDSLWWRYDEFPNSISKPKSLKDFIKELNTKYKVIKINNE